MNQRGFVSIITASVLMVIMALITIGFSRVMQREQRQAIDRQLSTQAFYAAESAVNDVRNRIESGVSPVSLEKDTCDVSDWNNGIISSASSTLPALPDEDQTGQASDTVSYTCLLIDASPNRLEFNNGSISPESSRVFDIQPLSGNVNSVTFAWTGTDQNRNGFIGNCNSINFPGAWPGNRLPVLRIDLINTGTGGFSRASLINGTSHFYVYPCNGGGSVPFTSSVARNGQAVGASCSGGQEYQCSVTINGIGSSKLVARVKSVYANADMVVTMNGGSGEFLGAQTVVDATGKANDVLRRIKVNIANRGSYVYPEFAFQAREGLCKRLVIQGASSVSGIPECR